MAIQNACRANAFTIVSTGVSTLRIRSTIHPTDAAPPKTAPILRNGYARVLLISISERRMITPTRRSHRAASSVAPHSWPKFSALVLDRRQHQEVYPRRFYRTWRPWPSFWGVNGELHFLTLISAERVQEAVIAVAAACVCASAVDFSNGPSRVPSPDQVSAELD